jgi:hypothetical protein
VDFSKNYTMKVQDEIQSTRWHNTHVNILVHITYKHNPSYDPLFPKIIMLKEVHYYLFYDIIHDTLLVQHVFKLHWEYLQKKGYIPTTHIVWSDGYSR